MAANLIPGKEIATRIQEEVKQEVVELKRKGVIPKLVAVQVGENAASAVYVKAQARSCEKVGINYRLHQLPAETSENELISTLQALNADSTVTGIILQLPLPQGLDVRKIQSFISPVKDVEGVNPTNMGWIVYGRPGLAPCTALAVRECLAYTGVKFYGKEVVMVGHSDIVGKPVALLLLDQFATTTVCHIGTGERGLLPDHVRRAEILIVAVGKAGLIKGEWV
ncbi:MAG TPA: bifunctional 5,10-methylenetetrahydrofolate dehydrogenase/5,10-methenyltetrahydrofolate cyclohydrolase, partial [bacterium]|nr:bifunctional 5,10-methylenetetrahydrofolate dehydrogenase/5,10-methenyltetrahydrofolate cyclohydrolase [bacterium]